MKNLQYEKAGAQYYRCTKYTSYPNINSCIARRRNLVST